jgi:hypothetical protein
MMILRSSFLMIARAANGGFNSSSAFPGMSS